MASETTLNTGSAQTTSCWQQVIESKWTDVALITGAVVLVVIGTLALLGVFGSSPAASYLGIAMTGGTLLFVIAEIVKVVINRCSSKTQITVTPLTQEEVQKLKEQAKLFAQINTGDSAADPSPDALFECCVKIIDLPEFQKDPVGSLVRWKQNRGGTEEFIPLEDRALKFFDQAVKEIRWHTFVMSQVQDAVPLTQEECKS